MILFEDTGFALGMMIVAMFLLGSWPNLFKLYEDRVRKERI
jgi:hypothetical protein